MNTTLKIINKGTGAGGANTNVSGKSFEEKTSIIPELIKVLHSGKYDNVFLI